MNTRTVVGGLLVVAALLLPKVDALVSMLPKTGQEAPAVTVVPEDQVWDELAAWAETGNIADTDELTRVARGLKELGKLSDISRLDQYKESNGPVTADVLKTVRGD